MNRTLVIYHAACRDGFCSAWVVDKYLRNQFDLDEQVSKDQLTDWHPAYYGQEPPDCKDKNVIIVDFSYDLETMKKIIKEANTVTWLDHHKTAEPTFNYFINNEEAYLDMHYNVEKSGAGLAWDFFFPNESRPWLVDYVEDRDLWKKKLNNTEEVNAYIACLEFSFDIWDKVNDEISLEQAAINGDIAIMKTEQYVREVCKNVYYVDFIKSNDRNALGEFNISEPKERYDWFKAIPVVNIVQVDCSEVCNELCKLNPEREFSLYWFKRADGMYQYGLRSIGDFDVSTVAKYFGGGGHKNAAGFQLPFLLEELR